MVISSFYCYSLMKRQRKDKFYYKLFFVKAVCEISCLKRSLLNVILCIMGCHKWFTD